MQTRCAALTHVCGRVRVVNHSLLVPLHCPVESVSCPLLSLSDPAYFCLALTLSVSPSPSIEMRHGSLMLMLHMAQDTLESPMILHASPSKGHCRKQALHNSGRASGVRGEHLEEASSADSICRRGFSSSLPDIPEPRISSQVGGKAGSRAKGQGSEVCVLRLLLVRDLKS